MTDETPDDAVLERLDFDPSFRRINDSTEGMNVGLGYRVVEALTRLADPNLEDGDPIIDTLMTECHEHTLVLYLLEQVMALQDRLEVTPADMAQRIALREFDI